MDRLINVAAALVVVGLLGWGWTNYFYVGCWFLGSRSSNANAVCGIPGVFVGFGLSVLGAWLIWHWWQEKRKD